MKGKLPRLHVELLVCLLLTTVVLATFWQVLGHDFTNWDDDKYVTQNAQVQRGLNAETISWAFTSGHASNWHPLTWISHMLDWSVFGSDATGHHAVNLVFHVLNTLLLFLVLRRTTGFVWRSAFVATLFGIHPLHVESVAWVAERKDVLSTFFWMLTMLAYVWYTERPDIKRYTPVFVLLALGLMAKPMLVSLPIVLVLLDYWPLRRVSAEKGWPLERIVLEKLPLFVLSAASCIVTYIVQERGGSMSETEMFSVGTRVSNALVAYTSYILKMFWPAKLWTPYLHPGTELPFWQVTVSGTALVLVTLLLLYTGRKRTYLSVGWLWFVTTLIPVIGLVQVGYQAMADRYTYIPLIGLFVALAWGVSDIFSRMGERERGREGASESPTPPFTHSPILPVLSVLIIAVLIPVTWKQTGHWKNGKTLFEHTLAVNPRNEIAHNNLGVYLEERGDLDAAAKHYLEAMKIAPGYAYAYLNLGNVFSERKEYDKAMVCYQDALKRRSDFAEARANIANLLAQTGKFDDSIEHFDAFLEEDPNQPQVLYNRGKALMNLGRLDEAIEDFRRVVELDPGFAEVHYSLGLTLKQLGDIDGAAEEYAESVRLNPEHSESHNNLANILLSRQKYDEAIAEYQEAIRVKPTNAEAQNNLAGAYYFKGDYQAAAEQVRRARKLGLKLNPALIEVLSQKIPGL